MFYKIQFCEVFCVAAVVKFKVMQCGWQMFECGIVACFWQCQDCVSMLPWPSWCHCPTLDTRGSTALTLPANNTALPPSPLKHQQLSFIITGFQIQIDDLMISDRLELIDLGAIDLFLQVDYYWYQVLNDGNCLCPVSVSSA